MAMSGTKPAGRLPQLQQVLKTVPELRKGRFGAITQVARPNASGFEVEPSREMLVRVSVDPASL